MQLNKGIFFLDLGMGHWKQGLQLAKKVFDVISLDISETVNKRNKILYRNKYPNLELVIYNILVSNFKNNYFDLIFERDCFHMYSQ